MIRTLLSSSILYGTRNCITLLCSLEAMKEDAVRLRFTIEVCEAIESLSSQCIHLKQDEGETIPKHELATLFQRFSRKSVSNNNGVRNLCSVYSRPCDCRVSHRSAREWALGWGLHSALSSVVYLEGKFLRKVMKE